MLHPFLTSPLAGTLGAPWHWQVGINLQQGFPCWSCLWSLSGTTKPQNSAQWSLPGQLHISFLLLSHTRAHHRVSKVLQKMCLLGEQRTRTLSILTLSWRSQMSPQYEWLLLQDVYYTRICDLQRREFQSGVRDKAWLLGAFCVAKFYSSII